MRRFKVYYHSRYYKFDRATVIVRSTSKKQVREDWHSIMCTDEYVIEKIMEVE